MALNRLDDDDPLVISCVGPPVCLLLDDAAVAAGNAGCELCRRIVLHPDGSQTVLTRTVN